MLQEYKILFSETPPELNDKVNELIKQGWELFGVPFIRHNWFLQTMVKYKEEEATYSFKIGGEMITQE